MLEAACTWPLSATNDGFQAERSLGCTSLGSAGTVPLIVFFLPLYLLFPLDLVCAASVISSPRSSPSEGTPFRCMGRCGTGEASGEDRRMTTFEGSDAVPSCPAVPSLMPAARPSERQGGGEASGEDKSRMTSDGSPGVPSIVCGDRRERMSLAASSWSLRIPSMPAAAPSMQGAVPALPEAVLCMPAVMPSVQNAVPVMAALVPALRARVPFMPDAVLSVHSAVLVLAATVSTLPAVLYCLPVAETCR